MRKKKSLDELVVEGLELALKSSARENFLQHSSPSK
jgi:hypothetical protein